MASSAPKIAAQEHFEAPEAVQQKAKALADEIKKSKHFIAFTGAGISTSTGAQNTASSIFRATV